MNTIWLGIIDGMPQYDRNKREVVFNPVEHPQLTKSNKVNTSQIYTIDYTQDGN